MWVVMLPGEYPETSDLFGPFRSEDKAEFVAELWNNEHPEEKAVAIRLQPVTQMNR